MASVNYKPLPPAVYLRECFDYNPVTGQLFWRYRPIYHFKTLRGWRSFNSQFEGKEITRTNRHGYKTVQLTTSKGKRELGAHRVIWCIHTGEDPKELQIDHINRNPGDNRIQNLRLATPSQNTQNTRARTGRFKGIYFDKSKKKWKAQYQKNGKRTHIGQFISAREAAQAFDDAVFAEYGEFAELNFKRAPSSGAEMTQI